MLVVVVGLVGLVGLVRALVVIVTRSGLQAWLQGATRWMGTTATDVRREGR